VGKGLRSSAGNEEREKMKTEKTQEIYGMKTCLYCKHYKTKNDEFPCADCSQSNNGRMGYSANLWEPEEVAEKNANEVWQTIKDSGERRVFETGAVRDCAEGKGRMDLLPWNAVLEVSKHCERGAAKYGEHNVDLGLPLHSFVDSGFRHLAKFAAGYVDEAHLTAAVWNLLWALEFSITRPDLVDVPWKKEDKHD
jgi:hypothetical protein